MDNLTFEQQIMMLAAAKGTPKYAELLNKFTSTDKDVFLAFNAKSIPFEKYMEMNREKFQPVADRAAYIRTQIKNRGWTDKKYEKYLGELPEDLVRERPEFSPYLPKKQRDENMRNFFKKYPQFRVDQ